ncbi:MAG TPA: M20 aminoacylase family protein [Rubrivivax sp.]|nr:M20 aminoacylase family protein [Rubrivivax sp.]
MTALREEIATVLPEMIELRHHLHQHPELAFEEHATSDLVAQRLTQWGYNVHRGLGGTGLVGTLRHGSGAKSIGIRADMDALPIVETTGLAYASRHHGKMHACGHDGHTATLLAAARHMALTRRFNGTLNLIFQPAEEGAGGARRMIDEGLFERFPCDAIFALHNSPGQPVGTLAFRSGAALASADGVSIVIHGKGGHAALPHFASDPIVAGSSMVMALQSIVSRNVDPLQSAVVTVGVFHAGTVNNVIPGSARLELSVRALDREVRALLRQRIHEVVAAQANSLGVRAEVDYQDGYPVLVNSAAETAFAARVGTELLGKDKVLLDPPAVMGSEDFAFMLEHRPGCYLFLGNGGGAGSCMVHNPGYDFNDAAMETGAAFWSLLTERWLS